MTISRDTVTAIAPDQASLNAANKLMKSGKWPLRQWDSGLGLVWGECQGSGANPYRVTFDLNDHGYKCTCPSRKFPCKHVLALMWMYADTPGDFSGAAVPDWVGDWLGRRRISGKDPATVTAGSPSTGKSLAEATAPEMEKPRDPKAEARARAAAEKRAEETEAALLGAMDDLETWITDQLRTGLAGLMDDLAPRCRAIAARMVDGKATALAGRLDELPAELLALPRDERLDMLVSHLGKLVILARAFRANPNAPDIRRAVASSEKREDVLENTDALRVKGRWEVAGERITTRRDGLVSQATWLLNLGDKGPRFALLLDFFPASAGKRSSSFAPGEQFDAELAFYPGIKPVRAVLAERAAADDEAPWPRPAGDPLACLAEGERDTPWDHTAPVLLPEGRLVLSETEKPWWRASDGSLALPLATIPEDPVFGMVLERSAALWDGTRLSLLSAKTDWGRVTFGE